MADLEPALPGLQAGRQPTEIADHGTRCCVVARTWLRCLDAGFHRGRAQEAPPGWIAQRWPRGATTPPLHWCEIPAARALSPGVSAALARELWSGRCEGLCAVELIEHDRPGGTVAGGPAEQSATGPAGGALVYDEAVGRERGDRLEIWRPRDGTWRRPPGGAGRVPLSLRVAGQAATILHWGEHRLARGRWVSLDAPPPRLDLPVAAQSPNAASAASAPTPARSQNA